MTILPDTVLDEQLYNALKTTELKVLSQPTSGNIEAPFTNMDTLNESELDKAARSFRFDF